MDYSKKKKAELKTLCKERIINGITGKNVKDLIKILSDYDEKQLCDSFMNKNTITPVLASIIDAEPGVKPETAVKAEIKWNPWTEKSQNIPFKSNTMGIGDGEEKVAHELETNVLGQNSPYDMNVIINGVSTECDVKKLDANNDFNTGVKGRNVLRPIKIKLVLLLESISLLSVSTLFTSDENEKLKSFIDVSPDELSVGTLKRLKSICEMLKIKQKSIMDSIPVIQPFRDTYGDVNMTLDIYYMICEKMSKPFPAEYSSYISTLQYIKHFDNDYIQNPDHINKDLDNLTNFLKNTTLIIVDENQGYMFISDISRLRFLRITRGHPRFQIIF